MANANRPKGFRPHERALRESPYAAGGTIYPGDAVTMNSSGLMVAAAAGEALAGVAASYAADGGEVLVWDHPDQKFEGQCDDGTSVAQTDMGNNCDILATAGNSTYKASRMEIDISSKVTTAAQVKLLRILPAIDNAAGEFAKVVFVINESQLDILDDTGV